MGFLRCRDISLGECQYRQYRWWGYALWSARRADHKPISQFACNEVAGQIQWLNPRCYWGWWIPLSYFLYCACEYCLRVTRDEPMTLSNIIWFWVTACCFRRYVCCASPPWHHATPWTDLIKFLQWSPTNQPLATSMRAQESYSGNVLVSWTWSWNGQATLKINRVPFI